MKKRYRNRCGLCITTPPTSDGTINSNRISKCDDVNNLGLSDRCRNGFLSCPEEVEMTSVNGKKNSQSICLLTQPISSTQPSSAIVKRNFVHIVVYNYWAFVLSIPSCIYLRILQSSFPFIEYNSLDGNQAISHPIILPTACRNVFDKYR